MTTRPQAHSIAGIIIASSLSPVVELTHWYYTRMFCERSSFCKNKIAKPLTIVLVNTHNPCQNSIVRSQRVKFSADFGSFTKGFHQQNIV